MFKNEIYKAIFYLFILAAWKMYLTKIKIEQNKFIQEKVCGI